MIQESPRMIVLASRSPRRLELAMREGWKVKVVVPPEEAEAEAAPRAESETLEDYVCRLASAKAQSVVGTVMEAAVAAPGGALVGSRSESGAMATILACDTLSEVEGEVLGKPLDRDDARRMLLLLSGREHRVVSGVCLWQLPEMGLQGSHGGPLIDSAESTLSMGPLSDDFLDWYLDSGMWQGKAGACGFQDERLPLRLVSGSPSNVVGLPLELIREMLAKP
ncbi:MAG: Maf family protein [Pirellulales bacterium]